MAVLKKSEIKRPVLPMETIDVPELGGEVIVQGLLLKDRLALFDAADKSHAAMSLMLASTVVDGNSEPIYTSEEWEKFGASHFNAALGLFDVARRLSGMNAEVATKN